MDTKTVDEIVTTAEKLQTVVPTTNTGKYVGLALSFALVVGAPLTTAVFSHCQQRQQTHQAAHELKVKQQQDKRKLQAELFTRVIGVAEKATLQDPTSMFQLGIIAQMVNANPSFFGVELQDAEQQYRGMFDRLAPISGLRKRLAETNVIMANLQRDLDAAVKEEKKLDAEILELRNERKALKPEEQWRRDSVTKQINRKEREIHQHRTVRRFNTDRLKIEENFLKFFTTALEQQTTELNRALLSVAEARDKAANKTVVLKNLATKLRDKPTDENLWRDFWEKIQDITQDHDRLRGSIERLQAELSSEQTFHQTCEASLQLCLQTCRKRTERPTPTSVPTSTANRRPAAATNPTPKPEGRTLSVQRKRPMIDGLF
jgi:hypothetical protein